MKEVDEEHEVNKFFNFLQGEDSILKLNQVDAFSVIYYLQEHFKVISQSFEKCEYCSTIFDTNESGHTISDDYEDDQWYKDCGFTSEDIAPHEGKSFCDNQCEYGYLNSH